MVELDNMVTCYLITPTNTSSGDNLRLGADIVVNLHLSGWRLRIETSGLFAETSKVVWFFHNCSIYVPSSLTPWQEEMLDKLLC